MRDPARIERISKKIAQYWETLPDMRLGQLICAIQAMRTRSDSSDPFHMEDEELERFLDDETRKAASAGKH